MQKCCAEDNELNQHLLGCAVDDVLPFMQQLCTSPVWEDAVRLLLPEAWCQDTLHDITRIADPLGLSEAHFHALQIHLSADPALFQPLLGLKWPSPCCFLAHKLA